MISTELGSTPLGAAIDLGNRRGLYAVSGLAFQDLRHGQSSTQTPWHSSPKQTQARNTPWREHQEALLGLAYGFSSNALNRLARGLPYRDAIKAVIKVVLRYASPRHQRLFKAMDYAGLPLQTRPVRLAYASPRHQRKAEPVSYAYRPHRAYADRLPWGLGRKAAKPDRLVWHLGGQPAWGKPEPYHDPYDLDQPPVIQLDPGHWQILVKRTYRMLHDISLVRLPDRTPLACSRLAFSINADNPHMQAQATLHGLAALEACKPDGSGPIILEATIDGYAMRFVLDPPQRDESFAARSISVTGRSLTWYLGAPWNLPADYHNDTAQAAQALAGALLPSDWSLSWNATDWTIAPGAFSISGQTPIQALQRITQAIGAMLIPSRNAQALAVRPRYPHLPWDYASANPNLTVPTSAILSRHGGYAMPSFGNAVYVYGGAAGGVMARVLRQSTAGDELLPAIQDDLITDQDAAYARGKMALAANHQAPAVRSFVLPLSADFQLAELGWLVKLTGDTDGPVYGTVSAVSWEAVRTGNSVSVTQTITLGTDSGDPMASFNKLIAQPPLLAGVVVDAHDGQTATVQLAGGGLMRVRGTAELNAHVFIKDGRLDSLSPAFASVDWTV